MVNPVAASLVGATLLSEPLRWDLVAGIVTVFIGIWIATRQSCRRQPPRPIPHCRSCTSNCDSPEPHCQSSVMSAIPRYSF
jgi:hypothetical protein